MPPISGPIAKPAIEVVAACVAARRVSPPGGTSSVSAAVPAPVKSPTASPEVTRPANRAGTPFAKMKSTMLSAPSSTPGMRTARRPIRSERLPNRSTATSTPNRVDEARNVSTAAEKWNSRAYAVQRPSGTVPVATSIVSP